MFNYEIPASPDNIDPNSTTGVYFQFLDAFNFLAPYSPLVQGFINNCTEMFINGMSSISAEHIPQEVLLHIGNCLSTDLREQYYKNGETFFYQRIGSINISYQSVDSARLRLGNIIRTTIAFGSQDNREDGGRDMRIEIMIDLAQISNQQTDLTQFYDTAIISPK